VCAISISLFLFLVFLPLRFAKKWYGAAGDTKVIAFSGCAGHAMSHGGEGNGAERESILAARCAVHPTSHVLNLSICLYIYLSVERERRERRERREEG
jgi:hypothetical protein